VSSVTRGSLNLSLALQYGPGSVPHGGDPRGGHRSAYLPQLRPARFALLPLTERCPLDKSGSKKLGPTGESRGVTAFGRPTQFGP
jgi:hypothetical protein